MIVIADISVPVDAFPFGRLFDKFPSLEIELERIVPLSETIVSLFWVGGYEGDGVGAHLEQRPKTDSVSRLTEADGRILYEVHWEPDPDGLVQTLIDCNAQLLQAEGMADVWDFRLQFESRGALSNFRQTCADADIPVTLRRLYNPSVPADSGRLTDCQYETLVAAYEQGYFQVPRATSMNELAAQFDISDNALSQRIRRGTAALIEETLVSNL